MNDRLSFNIGLFIPKKKQIKNSPSYECSSFI